VLHDFARIFDSDAQSGLASIWAYSVACAWEVVVVTSWRIRDFHDDDLDMAIPLWGDPTTAGAAAAFGLSEIIAAIRAGQPAVVAFVGSELVGSAVAMVDRDHAWIMRISLAGSWRKQGVGSALLETLENRLVTQGVRRISCLFADSEEVGAAALEHRGFNVRQGLLLYEKVESVATSDIGILSEVGGRMLGSGLWEELGGMVREKELIERRVILPLANEELAGRVGLFPPRGIMLFGPPGTGKTSFAKGVASRLGWPFVELFPSRLAGESSAGLASALRETFGLVGELDQVVVFIDEVEEIASAREQRTLSAAHGVTNEMLKLIPSFREKDRRLLVCATNSVRAIDSAFLRHGRFDYVIPVGPPDPDARRAIWIRYLSSIPSDDIDLDAIVSASSLFTPADIEFAARRAAQAVFEEALLEKGAESATTELILNCIHDTRPTLSPRIIEEFQQDIEDFARV
jgi:transitional endoplasmic reticulum ATPase